MAAPHTTALRRRAYLPPIPILLVSLLLVCVLPSLVSGFFLARTNSSNIEAPSPFFVFGVTDFSLNGEFIKAAPVDGCDKFTINATDKVVWIEPFRCSIETKIRNCALAGCIAAVSSSAYRIPGNEMWTQWDGTGGLMTLDSSSLKMDSKKLPVPFVHVGRDHAALLVKAIEDRAALSKVTQADSSLTIGTTLDGSSSTISSAPGHTVADLTPLSNLSRDPGLIDFHVYLSSGDSPNQWQQAFSSLYFTVFFQVMLGVLHVMVLLVAMAKFKRYWALRESRPFYAKIPLVCLAFLVISNLERALYCFIDPMGATHVMPRGYRRVMMSISVPWTYASTLLLTFFWAEAISGNQRAPPGLQAQEKHIKHVEPPTDEAEPSPHARGGSIELAALPATALNHSVVPSHQPSNPRYIHQAQPLVRPKMMVRSPPRTGRHVRLLHSTNRSVGQAGQYNEPFQPHRDGQEEDEDDLELEEYVERRPQHQQDYDMEYARAMGMVHMHQQQLREAGITCAVANINHVVVRNHMASSSMSMSPPPPPASPPAIPAPEQLNQVFIHRLARTSSISTTAAPSLEEVDLFAGLKSEPLYVHVHHASPDAAPVIEDHRVTIPMTAASSSSSAAVTKPNPRIDFLRIASEPHPASIAKAAALGGASTLMAHQVQFLVRYRVLFTLSVILLAVMDLTFSILDGMYLLDWQLLPLVEIIFATIGCVISGMYFYVSWKLIRWFQAEAATKIKSAEYNATQGHPDSLESVPTTPTTPGQQQQYVSLDGRSCTPTASAAVIQHAFSMVSGITRAHRDRMVRMCQFMVGSGLGLLLFLAVTLASPQLWHTSTMQNTLDDPFTTISRDFLVLLALFIVGACQVCAF